MNDEGFKIKELLTKALNHISRGEYDDSHARYMLFGAKSWHEAYEDIASPDDDYDYSNLNALVKFDSDVRRNKGDKQVAARISLGQSPEFKSDAFTDHSKEALEALSGLISAAHPAPKIGGGWPAKQESDDHTALHVSVALAHELLRKLPEAKRRTTSLPEMGLMPIQNSDVTKLFEEAHRCYLYGLDVACTVMCRAILEAGLADCLTMKRPEEYKARKSTQCPKFDLEKQIQFAKCEGILKGDRPRWAHLIRRAGNDAVHNHKSFAQNWGKLVDKNLRNTREILIDLYRDM